MKSVSFVSRSCSRFLLGLCIGAFLLPGSILSRTLRLAG